MSIGQLREAGDGMGGARPRPRLPVAVLDPRDAHDIRALTASLASMYFSSDDPALLESAALLAHDIPVVVKRILHDFRIEDRSIGVMIRGHLIDSEEIGPTPPDWRTKVLPNPALKEELAMVLYGGLLGEPFGWRTQQDGRIIHEVAPIQRDEHAQLGSGSRVPLSFHTEDAFHKYRADYLLLLCLRNPDRVATTLGFVDVDQLDDSTIDLLFEARYVVRPDESHFARNNTTGAAARTAFESIERLAGEPPRIALFNGDRSDPYIRLDPYYMDIEAIDPAARRALDLLIDNVESNLVDLALEVGDLLVLDNYRAVHGRQPFIARYDGTDRWLKRLNVVRDLRRSRAERESRTSRLIGRV